MLASNLLIERIRIIIEKVGVKNPPIPLNKVASLFSIEIVPYPHFSNNISGTIVNRGGHVFIGINPSHSKTRQRFTIAHELGHFLMGHDEAEIVEDKFDKSSDKEKEANQFASELLMPKDFILKDITEKNGRINIKDLAKRYEVSEQAMSIRLLETGLINRLQIIN